MCLFLLFLCTPQVCKSMSFFFTKLQAVTEAPVANGTIANIQFGQDTLDRYDQQAISWKERVLGRVNDTLVRCKGKVIDEIHLEPNGSKHQEYALTLRDSAAVDAFKARVLSREDDIEDFHFVEISFIALFARMKVESNRKTMTEVCEEPFKGLCTHLSPLLCRFRNTGYKTSQVHAS